MNNNVSWGAGNDYSMILHAVEDNITDVINISDSSSSENGHDSDSDNGHNNAVNNESILSTSENMRIELQLDNALLQNEELRDKLRTQKDDFGREKDKYLRQLQFLESENISVKKELATRTDKYYETKKKLQTVVRSADSEKRKLQEQLLTQVGTGTGSAPCALSRPDVNKNEQTIFHEKMTQLERRLMEKSSEARNLTIQNAQLQEEHTKLQQQILLSRSEASNDREEEGHSRELQTRVRDLEFALRQKNRDHDKLERSTKNSRILEEELASCNSKVASLQESVRSYRAMEVDYTALVQEKKSWAVHFQEMIHKADTACRTAEGEGKCDVTPVVILRFLSSIQSKCATLLHEKGKLESQVSDLTSAQQRSVLAVQQSELTAAEQAAKMSQLENANALLRQQAKLYEGEVVSLRSLLKTFDAEIMIFGNQKKRTRTSLLGETNEKGDKGDKGEASSGSEVDVLLALKNKEIAGLQREIDEQRTTGAAALRALMADVEGLTGTSRGPCGRGESDSLVAELREERDRLRERVAVLQDDMFWFQRAAGFDFVPAKTKVLHFRENPSLSRLGASASTARGERMGDGDTPSYFVTPLDELKHLKTLVRTGKLVPPASASASALPTAPDANTSSASEPSTSTGGGGGGLDISLTLNASRVGASASSSSGSGGGVDSQKVDSQKMNQRLKAVFREKIAEYREAVYLLFGYKVDLMPADSITGEAGSSMLKLRSMFAESPDDALKFIQRKGHDGLEILETPFASGLDESIMQALQSSNSVPVFLSEITLDLFGKQTFLG